MSRSDIKKWMIAIAIILTVGIAVDAIDRLYLPEAHLSFWQYFAIGMFAGGAGMTIAERIDRD